MSKLIPKNAREQALIMQGYKEGCQETRQADIEALCPRCAPHEKGGMNRATKAEGKWYHFYATDYFVCPAAPLHELAAKEGG